MKSKKGIYIPVVILLIISLLLFISPKINDSVATQRAINFCDLTEKGKENIQKGSFTDARDRGVVDDKGYLTETPVNDTEKEYTFPVFFEDDLERLKKDSMEYNEKLRTGQDFTEGFDHAVLSLSDYGIFTGIYGYIICEKADIYLPLYLGADSMNMSMGAAHLSNTSLPLGENDSNCVICGHTGYTGVTFFDSLPLLIKGDTVEIHTLFDDLTYSVSVTKVIKNGASNECYIQKDRDLLTLITCSNGGHDRYMVQCERQK